MATIQTLISLPIGQLATIQSLHAEPNFKFRLNGLGFRIGKSIKIIRKAPFNGPLHLKLDNTEVMIRQQDAANIEVIA
ncbi:MAG: FeoA family protein [Gammaproteobacteria bacterium]|nr:FeoA family protein [Gammaproteobacteria bacterium]